MNKKTLGIFCIILAAIAVTSTILYFKVKKQYDAVINQPDNELLKSIIKDQEAQREVHRARAEYFQMQADSLQVEIAKLSKKSQKTKIQYVQDINAWRALPDNDRDVRVQFFTRELATVDTIADW
jgi:Na+-translocating ferredoxin:NAD+ oxidoreductase RnfG subunit